MQDDHIEILDDEHVDDHDGWSGFVALFEALAPYVRKGSEVIVEREYDEMDEDWEPGDAQEVWIFDGKTCGDDSGQRIRA